MSAVNWEVFSQLPGAVEINFEKLARALIRRHYGQYGDFKELANQAGVEFHLKLHSSCALGDPGRWYGWQCKWYNISPGRSVGNTRRKDIVDGLDKSAKTLIGLTDWVLWTRNKLTAGDQDWFYGLQSDYPFRLALATGDDIADLLVGPASILKEAYFGELVLRPEEIAQQQAIAVAPVKRKFQPEVHQSSTAEEKLQQCLGGQKAWCILGAAADRLNSYSQKIQEVINDLPSALYKHSLKLIGDAQSTVKMLVELHKALEEGDMSAIRQLLVSRVPSLGDHRRTLAKLRSARSTAALFGTNVLADLYSTRHQLLQLQKSIEVQSVSVLGDAGYGKSELAIKLTLPDGDFPGGVLILGNALHANQTLDHLAQRYKIVGKSVPTFEQLIEAVDAAGQRSGRRIPIVFDGLNESEDPRNWKALLASAQSMLHQFPYVLLVVTLRSEFADECLPEDIEQLPIAGFTDRQTALKDYFEFYKIDVTDADLPLEYLEHPLTLRIFCEVANESRQQVVGVEALPSSLTTLFARHFAAVANRIASASPLLRRIYSGDVLDALILVGELLWKANGRSLCFRELRELLDGQGGWGASLVRSFESEGILMRVESEAGHRQISVVYDLMAGQLIAKYLLEKQEMQNFLCDPINAARLDPNCQEKRHALAHDTLKALVELFPSKKQFKQFWQVAPPSLFLWSLYFSIFSDPTDINHETVNALAVQANKNSKFATALFPRLQSTRAAKGHPLDAHFLDDLLRKMTPIQRDQSWSEWVFENSAQVENDLNSLQEKWANGGIGRQEIVRARWVMWTLTTTNRYLRDVATHTLYTLALRQPSEFFSLMIESLTIPDAYVPERMCAAGYGAALSAWSNGSSSPMAEALPRVAQELFKQMFLPPAPGATRHVLLRQHCLGIIFLALRVAPGCIAKSELQYLKAPFAHLRNPFCEQATFSEELIAEADRRAINMDFGNYTIGRLVSNRANYDFKNAEYQKVRRAIVKRMLQLGYDPTSYQDLDSSRISLRRGGDDGKKIDRYGKKYSWIAYYEMWGWRSDNGLLDSWRNAERPSDVDIDPSFPGPALEWEPPLHSLFSEGPRRMLDWIQKGPTPDYCHLLHRAEVAGLEKDWIMIDGLVEETAPSDYRNVITFIRAYILKAEDVNKFQQFFNEMKEPGNNDISRFEEKYYTYAGEMCLGEVSLKSFIEDADELSRHKYVRFEHSKRENKVIYVQLPVHEYSWEGYHSGLNQISCVRLPSPNLCHFLKLRYSPGIWDMSDSEGVASLYRRFVEKNSTLRGDVSYLRADLMERYLHETGHELVWMIWGERDRHYRGRDSNDDISGAFAGHKHIHKKFVLWDRKVSSDQLVRSTKKKVKAK